MKAHQRIIREANAMAAGLEDPPLVADITTATVRAIGFTEAKRVIMEYEWLGKMPMYVSHTYGIFFEDRLGGVVVYSPEYAENLGVWDRYGFTGKILCLSRGACVYWAHPHSASKLIRQSMR
jgi:hypothetical protein